MRILGENNTVIDTNQCNKQFYYNVFSYRNNEEDFYLDKANSLLTFDLQGVVANIGGERHEFPLNWSIMCVGVDEIVTIPLFDFNGMKHRVLGKSLDRFFPHFLETEIVDIVPTRNWVIPDVAPKTFLMYPLEGKTPTTRTNVLVIPSLLEKTFKLETLFES